MRSILARTITAVALTFALAGGATGCGGDPGCEKVVDHMLSIMPAEFKEMIGDDKKELVGQCEKESTAAERKCAMKAKNLEDLQKCSKDK